MPRLYIAAPTRYGDATPTIDPAAARVYTDHDLADARQLVDDMNADQHDCDEPATWRLYELRPVDAPKAGDGLPTWWDESRRRAHQLITRKC
jgi:hypothetical protein